MKGYNKPLIINSTEYKSENVLVGCKRCNNSWYEVKSMGQNMPRINSAMRIYDYCDKCINETDKQEAKSYEELLKKQYGGQ